MPLHSDTLPSQPVFAFTSECCLHRGEAANINLITFGLTPLVMISRTQGLTPLVMISRTQGLTPLVMISRNQGVTLLSLHFINGFK
jgi:hypothetical protein